MRTETLTTMRRMNLWTITLTTLVFATLAPQVLTAQTRDIRSVRPRPNAPKRSVHVMGSELPAGFNDDHDESSLPYLLDASELAKLGLAPKFQKVIPMDLTMYTHPLPLYNLRIHAIRTVNDYQTDAATITPQQIKALVDQANLVYHSAGIKFLFDPEKDFEQRNSTLLNQDCSLANFGQNVSNPNWDPTTSDKTQNKAERTRVAKLYPGKIVVYFRYGTKFTWNDETNSWKVGAATGGFSSGAGEYVAMTRRMPEKNLLAHELGHYLHCPHTFVIGIDTVAKATQRIKDWVEKEGHSTQDGLKTFDGDGGVVQDTPPDAGASIFDSKYGEKGRCGPTSSVEIPVRFSNGYQAYYTLKPDRLNIMSYFKGCHSLGVFHLSEEQIGRARSALETGNRHHLIAPSQRFGPRR
jgi:hypothetical protein